MYLYNRLRYFLLFRLSALTAKSRSHLEVKLAWKRMKLNAKANISAHRIASVQTGGGEKPPSPSPEDEAVMAIAPHDFLYETNAFDSDSVMASNY